MREKVIKAITEHKIIVIVRGVAGDKLIPLAEALYEGGIRLMEVTYSADNAFSDAETVQNIRNLAKYFEGKMYVGAGTVLTEEQAERAQEAGAGFIVSPDVCPQIIEKARALSMVSIPGAMTPSEIQTAHRAGADFVKLFPAECLGTAYIKAIRAPLSHIRFLAFGGIGTENIADYINAGVCGVGVGSKIVDREKIRGNDFAGICAQARAFVRAV